MSMDADTPDTDRVHPWFLNAEELAATRAKVAKLQQRATRKGFTGTIDVAAVPATRSSTSAGGLPVTVHGFDVTITGEPPRYAGWRFVATVDAVEGGTILRYPPAPPPGCRTIRFGRVSVTTATPLAPAAPRCWSPTTTPASCCRWAAPA